MVIFLHQKAFKQFQRSTDTRRCREYLSVGESLKKIEREREGEQRLCLILLVLTVYILLHCAATNNQIQALPEYLLYACSRSWCFFVPNKRSLSSSYATCTGGAYKCPGKLEKEADGLTLTALACAVLIRCKSVCSVSRIRASVECCTSAFFLLFFKSTSASLCLQNKLCCA